MTLDFAALALAATCLLAFAVSLLVAVGVVSGQRWLGGVSPAARARLLLAAALAPASVVLTTAAAIVVDPHVFGCTAHLCLHTEGIGPPGLAALLVGIVAVCALVSQLGHTAIVSWRAHRLQRVLDAVAAPGPSGSRVLPIDEIEAFVLGLLRPRVYLSRGLLAQTEPADLQSVISHESAHARRRDPLRRLVASLGLAFHLPRVSSMLRRALARAQEMTADAEAARQHDPSETAGALVRLARLRSGASTAPAGALALLGSDLEARVRALVAAGPLPQGPSATALLGAIVVMILLALSASHRIHEGFEALIAALA